MDFGTSYGLAMTSGVNAYLPLLSYAIAARFFHLYQVNPTFSYITQDWFMVALAVLALADLFADKIPGVDHVWDAIHTVLRPIAGALVAAAATGPHASGIALPASLILGGTLAGMVHTTKAATRVASTATTAGCMNTAISIVEDIVAMLGIVMSLLLPVVMVVFLVIFVAVFLFLAPRIIKRFRMWMQGRSARPGSNIYRI